MQKKKLYKSYYWMHRHYVIKKMTEEEIAELAETTQPTINRWLKKHELK